MAVLQQPKSKVNIDYDEDEVDDDIEFDESDDEDLPIKPKALPPKRPAARPPQPTQEEEEEVTNVLNKQDARAKAKESAEAEAQPQYVQIPKVVSEADMLNIIYEQQIQILNLLQKKDE